MLNINREGLQTRAGLWAAGADAFEECITEWLVTMEQGLIKGARCNLSIWSNEYYLFSAVASFTVDGNTQDELVVDVGFHRDAPSDRNVEFVAEVGGNSGPPLAVMPASKISLDSSGCISKTDMDTAIAVFRSFCNAQLNLVVKQVADLASFR